MPPAQSVIIDRFKRLPGRSTDVWQGGLVRARTWVEEPDGSVRRPLAAVWVSHATGMMNIQLAETDDTADPGFALQVLADLGLKFLRSRPAQLEVADGTLGDQLREALAHLQGGRQPGKIEPLLQEVGSVGHPVHQVKGFDVVGPYRLQIEFADGLIRTIDFRPILAGELYGPLRDLNLFNMVAVDREAHTLVWPNGVDFDPAILHDWPDHEASMIALAQRWAAARGEPTG